MPPCARLTMIKSSTCADIHMTCRSEGSAQRLSGRPQASKTNSLVFKASCSAVARLGSSKNQQVSQISSERRKPGRRRRCRLATTASGVQSPAIAGNLAAWMTEQGAVCQVAFDGEDWRVESSDKISTSEALVRIPEKLAITTYDVREHDLIAEVAEGRDDFVGLALWVLAELAKGVKSSWHDYLASLPTETLSPIFWNPEERAELLKGSPVLELAELRSAAMDSEYAALEDGLQKAMADYPPTAYSRQAFRSAFGMVLARVTYLPSAGVLALIPLADSLPLTSGSGAILDYDVETGEVMVYADRAYAPGDKVEIADTQTRPNSELLLCRGEVDMNNVDDYMEYTAELLRIDPLYNVKMEILLASQLEEKQIFPLYEDRFPQQLLCYLRLTRIQNTEELMKLGDMQQDLIVSQMNEYEILQILMADCREKLGGYNGNREDEIKIMQRAAELTPREFAAAKMRSCEKRILGETMNAVRRRLAPIRGIPTKQGMEAPNADIIEIFDTIEALPNAPKEMWKSFSSWARGDHDK